MTLLAVECKGSRLGRGSERSASNRTAGDFFSAMFVGGCAGVHAAIVDEAIITSAAGGAGISLKTKIMASYKRLLTTPRAFFCGQTGFVPRPTYVVSTAVYCGTFAVANVTQRYCEDRQLDPTTPKFAACLLTNTLLSFFKESIMLRAFGNAAIKIPWTCYCLWLVRDAVTIAAFCWADSFAKVIQLQCPSLSAEQAQDAAGFVAPAAAQFVTTPLHLMSILYKERVDMRWKPFALGGEVLRLYPQAITARMFRISLVWGTCMVVNKRLRDWISLPVLEGSRPTGSGRPQALSWLHKKNSPAPHTLAYRSSVCWPHTCPVQTTPFRQHNNLSRSLVRRPHHTLPGLLSTLPSPPSAVSNSPQSERLPEQQETAPVPKSPAEHLASLAEPAILKGRFRITRHLGYGATAEVSAAVDLETGETVALKVFHSPTPEAERQIRNEIDAVSALVSEREELTTVVRYMHCFPLHRPPFLVMEYLKNGSLADLVERVGFLPDRVVHRYTRQLVAAVAHCHHSNVIHGDLKPANLLLGRGRLELKVGDFGISFLTTSSLPPASVGGTFHYLPPEAFDSRLHNKNSEKTDVWAIGCCVLFMLTGREPWSNLDASDLHPLRFGPYICRLPPGQRAPPLLKEVSPFWGRFLHLCFMHDPAERPSASTLLAILDQQHDHR